MSNLLYRICYSPLWLITLLPLKVLYGISDLVAFMAYRLAGYRRQVVIRNLKNAFPEKSQEEIRSITNRFYHHLFDTFIESIATINMSARTLNHRYRFINPELLGQFYEERKSIILLSSHQGNWEWMSHLPLHMNHLLLGVYHPIENRFFDRLFINLREKFGAKAVTMTATYHTLIEYKRKNVPVLLYLISDQRPQRKSAHMWTDFLNQDTPVLTGAEKIAKKTAYPVIFAEIKKIKRGYYDVFFRLMFNDPAKTKEGEITKEYIKRLEELIKNQPECWLWSHKRWRHKRHDFINA